RWIECEGAQILMNINPTWCHAFCVPGFLLVPDPRRFSFLAVEPPCPECLSSAGELLLLRLVGLAVSRAHDWQHHDGFSDRSENRSGAAKSASPEVVHVLPRLAFQRSCT